MTDTPEVVEYLPWEGGTLRISYDPQPPTHRCTKCGWEGRGPFTMMYHEWGSKLFEFIACPKCYIEWLQQNVPNTVEEYQVKPR